MPVLPSSFSSPSFLSFSFTCTSILFPLSIHSFPPPFLHISLPTLPLPYFSIFPSSLSFFQLFAAGIVGLGSYLIHLGEENDYSVITGSNIVSGAALLIVGGVITLSVSAIGIIGACGLWKPILFIVRNMAALICLHTLHYVYIKHSCILHKFMWFLVLLIRATLIYVYKF